MSREIDLNDADYESRHVHQVYEKIATHFSSTRFKPWPVVDQFLKTLPPGSVGLDVGCGNGKYLAVNPNVFIVASDRSPALIQIARQHEPHSAIIADTLCLPHPASRFDFAISIAVIHHLSSPARRVEAIRSILHTLRTPTNQPRGGQALIFVWALEQRTSRRGWDQGDDQDVLVPWVLKSDPKTDPAQTPQTYQRYYHLYREGEIQNDAIAAGGHVVNSGYDRDNWWVIIERKT